MSRRFTPTAYTLTITSGTSDTEAFSVGRGRWMGIMMSTAWTAAGIIPMVALTSTSTFVPAYSDDGNPYDMTVAADRYVVADVSAILLGAAPVMRLRSGTAAAAVNQAVTRTLTVTLSE